MIFYFTESVLLRKNKLWQFHKELKFTFMYAYKKVEEKLLIYLKNRDFFGFLNIH